MKFKKEKYKENTAQYILFSVSLLVIFFLFGIIYTLFSESLPALKEIGFERFFLSKEWYPTYDPPDFGILPLIAGSLYVTAIALVISIPLGLSCALYIHEFAGRKEKIFLKPFIELISSIPSVVFGFWGTVFLAPFIQKYLDLPSGYCALTAGIVLGIMSSPIIASLSEDALNYVPLSFKEASFALGADKFETLVHITIPAAASGIITSIILGAGRIIGETMVVLMLSGGAAVIPRSITEPVRPMTSAIAAEMGEAAYKTLHYHSLFAIALTLFFLTFFLNLYAEKAVKKYRFSLGNKR
ncbi:MAG: phosphate ABC transporter permease subunit PstC [Elusimicrobiota bacterium]